jgi:iron complex transport system permease protein
MKNADAPMTRAGRSMRLAGLVGALALVALLSLCIGTEGISPPWSFEPELRARLWELRLSRVLLAVFVGGALAGAGAVLQAVLRNPLADPYVLGVSGGAALGAALVSATGASMSGLGLSAAATLGALASMGLLVFFLVRDHTQRADTALLVGVTLNAFSWAVVAVLRAVVPSAASQTLSTWLIGSLSSASLTDALIAGALTVLSLAAVAWRAPVLALLSAGDDEAARLGVDVRRAQLFFLVLASVLVGAAVATCGVIGFVGLIAPHAVRVLLSRDLRVVLWGSVCVGALFLTALDAIARGAFSVLDSELPTGALCAVIGAPLFALALWRRVQERRA